MFRHADIDVQTSYHDDYSGRNILSTGKPEFEVIASKVQNY